MHSKSEKLLLGALLETLAPRVGAKVLLEPKWRVAGRIEFKNGKKSYFRYNALDLNPVGASEVAKDKDYANFFLAKMGYRTIEGLAFFSREWCEAIGSKRNADAAARYAGRRSFPLIAKPNSGTHGVDVFLVQNQRELRAALRKIFKHDRVALVQNVIRGHDYRIVVLDDEVISAYERVPLNIVGDGRSSIRRLLEKKQRAFRKSGRDTNLKMNDPRMLRKLAHQGATLMRVPARGERIFLLDNANLSSGGDALDVTNEIHLAFKKLAIAVTRDMGLRLCGVDLMVEGDIRQKPHKYRILEINAAPGLDHYVKQGETQRKIVEDLYLKVLKSLAG